MRTNQLLAFSSVLLGACVGGIDTGNPGGSPDASPGPSSAAKQAYETQVFPIVNAKCRSCHSGPAATATAFVGASLADAYDKAVGFGSVVGNFTETGAPILTKVTAAGGHQGQTYLPNEVATITQWLNLEVTERSGNPPPTGGENAGQVSERLVREWSGCMKLADFQAENMAALWSALPSSDGPCIRCHATGQASFVVMQNAQQMFEAISTNRYFMQPFFLADVADLANAKVILNQNTIDRVARAVAPHQAHPQFNPNANGAWDALEDFYEKTLAHKAASACDPPRIVP